MTTDMIPLEEYDSDMIPLEEYESTGFVETLRDVVSGRPARSSLPVNIGAEIAANLPTELGAAAGITRGMAPPVRGALAGASRGAVGGPLAALAYGTAGGLAGALAEQSLARGVQSGSPFLFGNPFVGRDPVSQPMADALWTVAGGMGFPLVLGALGRMGRRAFRRRTPGEEILQAQGALAPSRVGFNERYDLSQEFGVPYTYGELTGDRALMANREAIMRALPGSADPMTDFLKNRAGAIQRSVTDVASDIAPVTPYEAYTRAGEAARDTIKRLRDSRRNVSRKMYEDIWATNPRMRAEEFTDAMRVASVNQEAGLQNIYTKVIKDIQSEVDASGFIPAQKLHNIQSRYNARAKAITNDAQQQRIYSEIGQGIKGVLDRSIPGYANVSDVYRTMSQRIDRVRDATKIGKAVDSDRVAVANKVRDWFRGTSVYPEEIREIKQIWRSELDPLQYTETMKGLQAAFLREAVERIGVNQSGESILNVGGKIAQSLGGDPTAPGGVRVAQIVDELYTPTQRQKLNRMLRMLDDTSQILSIKSPTQPRLVAEEMQRTVGQDVLQELGQASTEAAATGGLDILNWALRSPGRLRDKVLRTRQKEMEANTLYAHALNQGTTATVQHFNKLEEAISKAREMPFDEAQTELLRAWGTLLGTVGASSATQ